MCDVEEARCIARGVEKALEERDWNIESTKELFSRITVEACQKNECGSWGHH